MRRLSALITRAEAVCLSVFLHDISKTDAAVTKRDIQIFHDESLKTIYFRVRGQGHESTSVGVCTLVSAGCFSLQATVV